MKEFECKKSSDAYARQANIALVCLIPSSTILISTTTTIQESYRAADGKNHGTSQSNWLFYGDVILDTTTDEPDVVL